MLQQLAFGGSVFPVHGEIDIERQSHSYHTAIYVILTGSDMQLQKAAK